MSGRRRFKRYQTLVPPNGCARIVSDCVVETWDRESAVVVTSEPAERNHELVIQFTSPNGATTSYLVRVMSCALDPRHGPMRFRLHVQLDFNTTRPIHTPPHVSARTSRGSNDE